MSDYLQTNGKTIEQAFTEYHEENPEVFEMFRKYLLQIVNSNLSKTVSIERLQAEKKIRTSSKMIINRIRWEIATVGIQAPNSEENVKEGKFDSFKINDAFTSRYARLFCDQNPEWSFLFNLRNLRS